MTDTIDEMKQRLAVLAPEHLEVIDESALHAGHAGAKSGGGHYQLILIAAAFSGQNSVARHRAIYQALGDLMNTRIHALAITALAPGEL
ncbi:MAG: BolA family protein [Pseudomonadota bacterium]|nr:BolA family protein [Pseudomonadota bacterium]MDP1903254.1 BolA family protein [Pseudomonadota bacterium]MDP2352763.1 BolA family protein [Pseudomonadota bacterium]